MNVDPEMLFLLDAIAIVACLAYVINCARNDRRFALATALVATALLCVPFLGAIRAARDAGKRALIAEIITDRKSFFSEARARLQMNYPQGHIQEFPHLWRLSRGRLTGAARLDLVDYIHFTSYDHTPDLTIEHDVQERRWRIYFTREHVIAEASDDELPPASFASSATAP
jgi:hypothetical protein